MSEEKISKQTEQLIEACIKGDRQSQSRLYNIYVQKMFVVCLRYARNREEAEDILQEGFMKVFEFLHQYKFAGSFDGWIRKIMVNSALQKYRNKGKLHPLVDLDQSTTDFSVHEDVTSKISTKELLTMVQQLPPAYRLIFNLYVFEGMKHREIAELLGISEGTSKSNLSDARAILQKAVHKSLQTVQVKLS